MIALEATYSKVLESDENTDWDPTSVQPYSSDMMIMPSYAPEFYQQAVNAGEVSERDWQEYCTEYLNRIFEQPEIVAVMKRLKAR